MKNQSGFTLLEVLISFSIVLLILSFLTPFLQLITEEKKEGLNLYEWEVFKQQAAMEIRATEEMTLSVDKLSFIGSVGEKISYEHYQGIIRRRVNGAGHEVMLQHIASVKYEPVVNGVFISIVDSSGEIFQSSVTSIAETRIIEK
jgi:competence protein ComGF